MTAATLIDSPWVDAAAPDLAEAQPYRAVHSSFMTVIATSADLTELIFALQAVAVHAAHMMAGVDGRKINNIAFAPGEIEMAIPGADQPVGMCELLMRLHFKGELSRTERVALFPFVPWDQFTFALQAAGTRRALQLAGEGARRIQL